MAPPTTPLPNDGSLLRGTASASVYRMQSGRRRLVPDSETLGFLSAATPIQTLSDADLAKIPDGVPLPSRANGALVSTGPLPGFDLPEIVFRMADGLRRLVPDNETLTIINTPPRPVQIVFAEDLAAIPTGASLPSLRDGATYQGRGAVYAYIIQAGHKRPVPDATSLRDLGQWAPPVAIVDRDLAGIPDGAAFPSTSRFLHPPDAKTPLVLLPVRLETRFQPNELWLRVYPDSVHIDSFEPELTPEESAARASYLGQSAGTLAAAQAAFTALAQRFGPQRAAWIASAEAKPGPGAARAPWVKALPERWIVIGYLNDDRPGEVIATGPPIKDTLPAGPVPGGPGPTTDEGMRWIWDFDQAVAAGMAFRIPLRPDQQHGFSRLVVVGLRSQLDPAASASRLGELLRAHHYTDGLQLMPLGVPTNNTEDVKSGLSTRDPGFAACYAIERGPPLSPSRPTSDGERLARALGLPPQLFAHVQGADGGQDEQAHAMQTVLWPATWRYYLEQIVASTVSSPQEIIPQVRSHYIEQVRARGHFPILRIGRQPYGLQPVSWSMQWKPLEGRAMDAPLAGLLTRLRTVWRTSIKNVPRIALAADPEQAFANFLSMSPTSTSFSFREVIGSQFNTYYWDNIVKQPLPETWWPQFRTTKTPIRVGDRGVGDSGSILANTLAASMTFANIAQPLSDVLVAPAPLDGRPAPEYVEKLRASSGWQALRDFPLPPQPVPLLLLLLRHGALRQYVDTALDLLEQAGPSQPSERVEPELVGLTTSPDRTGPWNLLQRPLPGRGAAGTPPPPVGTFLDGAHEDPALGAFAEFWHAFKALTTLSAEALDQSTREVLDLSTYRLDAWISSLAHQRLDDARRVAPDGGILLGGYGWLEEVRPAPVPPVPMANGGFVHAPSLAHATTAAVLRSGFLTHKGAARGPFEIDLSSERVRLGLHLLDGIREGQPLGALLGYRLERLLHENGGDNRIKLLRQNFPLGAVPVAEGGTAESIEAGNVVDGLALLRVYHNPNLHSTDWIPAEIEPYVKRLDDALDAVADLTLAESVHQLSRGNSIRAGATLDAIARGDAPPPELDFVQTPRAGNAVTHRLVAIGGGSAPGWGNTPRSKAEPRLNGWAASLFGDPKRVRARGRFTDSTGASLGNIEIGLDGLGLAPLDLLAIPEPRDGSSGELAERLRRAMAAARPPSVPATATVQILTERDPAWKADVLSLSEYAELLNALGQTIAGARALEPRDIAAPGETPGAIDLEDLQLRADASEVELHATSQALTANTALEAALLAAAAFGAANAIPAADPSGWRAQADRVQVELGTRIHRIEGLRSGDSPDAQRDHELARLKAIFGESFVVLPALAPALATTWPALWSNSASLQADDPFAAVTWFQRAARVRPGAGRLDRALLYAEALGGQQLTRFDVAQLPSTTGDRWLGLKLAGTPASGRLSLVAHAPLPLTPGGAVAGLVLDEWIEVLPSTQQMPDGSIQAQQISGVSFQYDDPVARPPQAILIAVRPDDFPEWTLESLEGSVLEALELAKIRAVDPDALETLGHYLPALYFAHNSAQPPNAVSIDFGVAMPPPGGGTP
jgi:hypothetical protein